MIDLNSNPVRHSSKFQENTKERYLSTAELQALSDQLVLEQVSRPFHVAAYRLLILTGARLNKVPSLKWNYADLDRQMVFLLDSKISKKEIILTNAAVKILKDLTRIAGNSFVIIGHKEGQHLVNLRNHWTEMRNKIGLQDVRLHDLRHSFASTAIAAGVPIALIGKLLVHLSRICGVFQ